MNQTNEIFTPFAFFLSEGMTHVEAKRFTHQIIEELRDLMDAGCIKTAKEYSDWSERMAYDLADSWLSDYLIAKYNIK